MIYHRVELLI